MRSFAILPGVMKKHMSYAVMLSFLLLTAALTRVLTSAKDSDLVPQRISLSQFPVQFETWRQIDMQALQSGTLRELKADDYLSGIYANDRGAFAYLFIAYYASQRQRQAIHSPQNCMPGSGWTMSRHRQHLVNTVAPNGQGQINEYLIEKDDEKMLAFYWYQGRGRIEASEYWARATTIKDAMWLGRTDGALVRVVVPVGKDSNRNAAEEVARAAGLDFSQKLLPLLPDFIPN